MRFHITDGKGNIVASFHRATDRHNVIHNYFEKKYPFIVWNKKRYRIRENETKGLNR